jgi:hypothetical protein
MTDIIVLVVNVLCELHQIIEEVRKNYDQLEMDNDEYRHGKTHQSMMLVIMSKLWSTSPVQYAVPHLLNMQFVSF